MPTASTIRPVDPQAGGFRALAAYLERRTPAGIIKTWRSWGGSATDEAPPTTGQLNWCRITPIAMPAIPMASAGSNARRLYQCPMRVEFEIVAPGPLVDDLISIWGSIESLIFPTPDPEDPTDRDTLLSVLRPFGVRDIRLLQRALPPASAALTQATVRADAAIALDFLLSV